AGLRRVPVLSGRMAPVRGDRADEHAVAGPKDLDRLAHLVHDSHGLVAEGQVLPRADPAAHGVGVRGADKRGGGLDDGIVRARTRYWLVHEADLTDLFHDKGFHRAFPRYPDRCDGALRLLERMPRPPEAERADRVNKA